MIASAEFHGSKNFGINSDSAITIDTEQTFTTIPPAELKERVEFLMKRVEGLERISAIYAENIPKMARDMNDLKEKVDLIYRKIIEKLGTSI